MGFIVVAAVIMVLGLLYALRAVFLVCQGTEDETAFFDQVRCPFQWLRCQSVPGKRRRCWKPPERAWKLL